MLNIFMKFEHLLVKLYILVHGKLHLRGAGWMLRKISRVVPGLRSYPLQISGVGTAIVDFSDQAAFTLLNFELGEYRGYSLLRYMEKYLRPGSVLWDVGANVGYVSSHFAKPRYQLGSIQAFEPNTNPLRTITALFKNHKIVQVHGIGLGDEDGQFKINVCVTGSEIGSLARVMPNSVPVEITVRRGDSVRQELNLPAPDVIKIDVEGFEPNVLKGLSKTIAEKRPVIFFEHTWNTDEQVKGLIPPGYALYFILDDGTIIADVFAERLKGHNAILVPMERKDLAPI